MVKHNYYTGVKNLGDMLSPLILDSMLDWNSIYDESKEDINLITLGSILAADFFRGDAVVWGTGIHYFEDACRLAVNYPQRKLDIRAVRGPITRKVLEHAGYECPHIYGDPAILMPIVYPHSLSDKRNKTTIIYKWKDRDKNVSDEMMKINVGEDDYKKAIEKICNSSLVISASLHGIILAESYGVPAVWLLEEKCDEILKYYDWYYSTGRYDVKSAKSIEEALLIEPMRLPNLEDMRKKLMYAFPFDIYKEGYNGRSYKTVIWGKGACFEKYKDLLSNNNKIELLVDNDPNKWGSVYGRLKCFDPKELKKIDNPYVVIAMENSNHILEIEKQLEEMEVFCYTTINEWMRYVPNMAN